MVTLNNLTMGFSQRTLFKDVSLSIFKNEKIGLTGPNGAGKTTLFSIIRGEMEPVAGSVQVQKNIHIGYLPQEAHFASTKTVMEEIIEGDERSSKGWAFTTWNTRARRSSSGWVLRKRIFTGRLPN